MSKLLNSVLDRISENNNEYRGILRNLNNAIEEATTSLVGNIVATSSYSADFSDTLISSKDRLVNPITKQIESYAIKDLRSVEMVNEQFVEKINDKLDNANITSKEEKDAFTNNLNVLLNEKYLQIVKIKRVDFINENGVNEEVENVINDFTSYLKTLASFDDESLNNLLNDYKKEIYNLISKTIKEISDLYLNNFVNEVSSSLNGAIDFDVPVIESEPEEEFRPFIPEINPVPEVDIPVSVNEELKEDEFVSTDAFVIPEISVVEEDVNVVEEPVIPEIPSIPEINAEEVALDIPEVPEVPVTLDEEDVNELEVKPIEPIEIKEEVPKRSYDVEEILKIAKSPIVTMPEEKENKNDYINVEPIIATKESDTMESEFNEREIVQEMIRRLTKRLAEIDDRKKKYEIEQSKLEEDESFVNNLIESSNNKKAELDEFEQELDNKEQELSNKKKELDKKINDVMPFANAVLNTEKES